MRSDTMAAAAATQTPKPVDHDWKQITDCKGARVLKPDGKWSEIAPKKKGKFTLDELSSAIGVKWIEILYPHQKIAMVCDDEGMLNGSELNTEATRFVIKHGAAKETKIYGAVLICPAKFID